MRQPRSVRPPRYLWQVLSKLIQELPHGLLFAGLQFGCPALGLLLRQDDMNVFRASPAIPVAFALHSVMRCC
jgi:hypothetical protein